MIKVSTKPVSSEYEVVIGRGLLERAGEELNLDRKVMIISDQGVPYEYLEKVMNQCRDPHTAIIACGEDSKSLDNFARIQRALVYKGFTRGDCIVAIGGGVPGDLAGFSAASFMRGIDFYNIPTTVLAQVDSSIGGKTAINFCGMKNMVGAFYQPKKVLIDTDTLKTLKKRQISEGLAEALKMAATSDASLFSIFENDQPEDCMETIIEKALNIKKNVVEQDEKEAGLRRVLNFGHTLGHGIEAASRGKLFHGECVALGMLPRCSVQVKERLVTIYEKLELPSVCKIRIDEAMEAVTHDKKSAGDTIKCVYVPEVGTYEFRDMDLAELGERLKETAAEA